LQTLCELCGLWQHDICYGLQRHGPQNKPNEHFCYACLLLPRAGPVNNEMPGVVRMRLALTHFYDQNVRVVEKELLMKAVRECPPQRPTRNFALSYRNFQYRSSGERPNGLLGIVCQARTSGIYPEEFQEWDIRRGQRSEEGRRRSIQIP
jgi:hypothetical protein